MTKKKKICNKFWKWKRIERRLSFLKNELYFITILKGYLNLTADVKEFSHCEKVKETSNLTNDILTNGIDFGYEMSDMIKIF